MASGKVGFLPCFSKYRHNDFPTSGLYTTNSYVDKVKNLLASLVDIENPMHLCIKCDVGKEIQPIRPDSAESKRIIKLFSIPFQIYRIDYGDNPFRILFAISNDERLAYILAFDVNHTTYRK